MYSDLIKILKTAFQITFSVRLRRRQGHREKIDGFAKMLLVYS